MNLQAIVIAIGLCAAALVAGSALIEPPRSGARLEFQTGSIRLEILKPGGALAVSPDPGCWRDGCPVFAVRARLFSAPPQRTQGEAGRVEYIAAGAFER